MSKGKEDDDLSSGIIHDGRNGCLGNHTSSRREREQRQRVRQVAFDRDTLRNMRSR
ncbi:hypothetical protein [Brucella sp. 09RB8471]|uniref:hypothetical protein n=1 Tax=Brucella sp. 09RB8471 TaxID=1149952 RepID=UPI0012EBA2AA|nr:hypothetical protein [Brucella sp. 09RB8471]